MNYLKCNSCGYLNKLDNENLLFCSKCNKKLENNFRDWKRAHSDSSFEDYKKLVCISELEISSVSNTKTSKRKGSKYWIGLVISITIFNVLGKVGGEKIVTLFRSEKTSQEILSKNWVKEKYGSLIIETPVIMTEKILQLPDNVMEVIEEMNSYEYSSKKGFKLLVNSIKYKPIVQEISLQGAANGSINEMKMQKGVTDFDYIERKVVLGKIPGFIQNGTYKHNRIPIEFINTCYGSGLNI